MKRYLIIGASILMVLLTWLVSSWVYTISGTFKSRVVSYAKAPAGTEMCMFQRFNLSTEPYSTALSRKPGGGWGWFYFDHEDHAWLSGGIILNTTNKITDIFQGTKKLPTTTGQTINLFI